MLQSAFGNSSKANLRESPIIEEVHKTMSRNPFTNREETYMRRAIELASRARGMTSPNPMVGAVIVKGGNIIGEGYHHETGRPHAEIEALKQAGSSAHGASMFVTLEPCCHHGRTPPCVDAIIEAGIKRVVVATRDPNPLVNGKGLRRLKQAGITTDSGLLKKEAEELNEFFFTYHRKQRPFIILKWAMSLDGKSSTDSGESKWITNKQSREYVHRLRSRVDAILIGAGTLIHDDPLLNVRLKRYRGRQPRRIILDYNLEIHDRFKCCDPSTGGATLIVTHNRAPSKKIESLKRRGAEVVTLKGKNGRIEIESLMELLYNEQLQSLLVEGGRRVAGYFLSSGMVDKIVAFIAPLIIGGKKPTAPIICNSVPSMELAIRLEKIQIHRFKDDICFEGYVAYP